MIGPPDLAVEILSASTAGRDRGIKKDLSCRAGVREYWVVDPQRQLVEQHMLSGDSDRHLG